MAPLRLFIAWLLLLALPLQGVAAATVLQCGPAQRALATVAGQEVAALHESGHAVRHGHAGGPSAPSHHAQADHDAHAMNATSAADHGAPGEAADGHGCFACAAACHAPALAGDPPRIDLPPAPQRHADAPFQGFESRPPPVPDKPPRA